MINLIVSGAYGRMGSQILVKARGDSRFRIVGALEAANKPEIGREIMPGIKLTNDLESLLLEGDVLIDFTTPEATLAHVRQVLKAKKAIVIGTTGFTGEQMEEIHKASGDIRLLMAPNMSDCVHHFYEIAKEAARRFRGYSIEIRETHHVQKKDKPSGTAKEIAFQIAQVLKRDAKVIPIYSIREGDIVGIHSVVFSRGDNKIELTHTAGSRSIFAEGALEAAEFIVKQKPGFYTMVNVINP